MSDTKEIPEKLKPWMTCIGKGWHPLVLRLHESLLVTDPNYEIYQVKEKFGGLRFYVGGLSTAGDAAVRVAEDQSYQICEECGEPGKRRTVRGWMSTLCDDHFRERVMEKEK